MNGIVVRVIVSVSPFTTVDDTVERIGSNSMMAIFMAFVVYKESRERERVARELLVIVRQCNRLMVKKKKEVNSNCRSRFTAEEFEQPFNELLSLLYQHLVCT